MDSPTERARLERLEIDYWRSSSASVADPTSVDSPTNRLNKLGDAGTCLVSLLPFLELFRKSGSILEIGAGQGATFCSRSAALRLKDGAVACVFCFASAHHFRGQEETLAEVARVLAPGGHCFYFHEPSCPGVWHPLAVWRVNKKRREVREDVLVPARMKAMAARVGLACEVRYTPSLYKRAPVETVYYALLNALPFLQRMLPCTATYCFSKN